MTDETFHRIVRGIKVGLILLFVFFGIAIAIAYRSEDEQYWDCMEANYVLAPNSQSAAVAEYDLDDTVCQVSHKPNDTSYDEWNERRRCWAWSDDPLNEPEC